MSKPDEVIAEAKREIERNGNPFVLVSREIAAGLVALAEQPRLPETLTKEMKKAVDFLEYVGQFHGDLASADEHVPVILDFIRRHSPPKPKGWRVEWSGGGNTVTDFSKISENAPCDVCFTVVPL